MNQKAMVVRPTKTVTRVKLAETAKFGQKLEEIYEKIARRAFEIFEGSGREVGHDLKHWFQAESELFHPVPVELAETEEALNVRAEVPGFQANQLEVSAEPLRLTISGKRETKGEREVGKTFYTETGSNQIFRVFDLPVEVDANRATGTLKDGILELTLPKAAAEKKLRVEAKAA